MRARPLLVLLLLVLSQAACGKPKVDKAFGDKVHAYLMEHPEVLAEASQKLAENQAAADQVKALAAIKTNRVPLERDSRDMVVNPAGKITLIEFFDYDCAYCKLVAPQVAAFARANPDVRIVFKDLTIFGEPSRYAAAGAQLVKDPARFTALYTDLMNQRPLTDDTVTQILRAHGVDTAAARARQNSPSGQAYLGDVAKLAGSLMDQVGTPLFVTDDTLVAAADWPAVQKAIEAQRKAKST
ncbi:MAG: disulfide bond formation protein DsbA [Caulobacteraceae bacterium]|nr:disulfide bond formation protein DsbA [Caulobacteraceae bacterium]